MNLLRVSGPVVVGEVLYAPGGICGPRVQPDYQLVLLHEGELRLRLDGKRIIELAPGEAMLLAPGHREFFTFSKTGETRHSWCSVRPQAVPRELRREFAGLERPTPFLGRMNTLLDWCRAPVADAAVRLQEGFFLGLALALLCDFGLAARREIRGPSGSEALERMGSFLQAAYAEPLALAEIARKAGVSPQHLLKLCRKHGLATPTEQLYRKRLEMAAEMLQGTGLAVGQIAERCGFANSFHFSRKFSQVYGRSPLAWRQNLWRSKRGSF